MLGMMAYKSDDFLPNLSIMKPTNTELNGDVKRVTDPKTKRHVES